MHSATSLNAMPSPFAPTRSRRHVVQPEHHVPATHDDRVAVGGRQDVVPRTSSGPRSSCASIGQRHVHRHLVPVEVRIERRATPTDAAGSPCLDQHRLECWMPRRCRVGDGQQHGMLADHFLRMSRLRPAPLHQALGGLDVRASPRSWSLEKMNGLTARRLLLRNPHWCRRRFGPTTMTERRVVDPLPRGSDETGPACP